MPTKARVIKEKLQELSDYAFIMKARSFINKPEKWCTRHNAKNKEDTPTSVEDKYAAKFCAVGALFRVGVIVNGDDSSYVAQMNMKTRVSNILREYFYPAANTRAIGAWNDSHTHKEVMAVYSKAAKLAKAKEQSK